MNTMLLGIGVVEPSRLWLWLLIGLTWAFDFALAAWLWRRRQLKRE
jgi:hypothetical protein